MAGLTYSELSTVSAGADPIAQRFDELAAMQDGWGGARTRRPSSVAMRVAKALAEWGRAYRLAVDVAPGEDGAVSVAYYKDADRLEVVVGVNAMLYVTYERGTGMEYEDVEEPGARSLSATLSMVRSLAQADAWNWSASSKVSIWTSALSGSRAPLSQIPADTTLKGLTRLVESLSSTWSAPVAA